MQSIELLEKTIEECRTEIAEAQKTSETITEFLEGMKPLVDALEARNDLNDLNDSERSFLRLTLNLQVKVIVARQDALRVVMDNAFVIPGLEADIMRLEREAQSVADPAERGHLRSKW